MKILLKFRTVSLLNKQDISGFIGMKTTQVCPYADDIAIIMRSRRGLEEKVLTLDSAERKKIQDI